MEEQRKDHYLERLEQNEAYRGSGKVVMELLQRYCFRIVKKREDQFHLRYLNGHALLNHFLTKIGFLDGWRQVIDPADEELIFAELERRLNQLAEAHGELRMTVPMLYLEGERSS